jgi:hypothetical protein
MYVCLSAGAISDISVGKTKEMENKKEDRTV